MTTSPGVSTPRPIPVAVAGTVAGIRAVIAVISFGALIFSGPLSPFVARGLGLALLSALIIGLVIALLSSYPGTVAICQDQTSAILALAAASAAAALPPGTSPEVVYATVVGTLSITALLTGALFLGLGLMRLGGLIRFIPFPVVGGFVAGSGWLLVVGSFRIMLAEPLTWSTLPLLAAGGEPIKWIPGLALAGALFWCYHRVKHYLAMPMLLLGSVAVFYLGLAVTGLSIDDAHAMGFLLGPFPEGSLWPGVALAELARVDWSALATVLPNIATITLISVLALLLYASGIELEVGQDLDFNRELGAAGLANLLVAAAGGLVGFHTLSLTALTQRLGAPSRLVGITAAAFCGIALFFGAGLLTLVPRGVLGGLVMFIGLDFLYQWIGAGHRRLPRSEYLIVWAILVAVAVFGFLEGILTGIFAGVVLFVVNYSRVRVVQYALSGAVCHSNVDRSDDERHALTRHGHRIHVLKLQGFLFFGTANHLFAEVRARAQTEDLPALACVLMDFRQVSGLDSSAVMSFVRMRQLATSMNFELGLTQVPPDIVAQLTHGGFLLGEANHVRLFDDLDHGLEFFEDRIITEAGPGLNEDRSLADRLKRWFPTGVSVEMFITYLEPRDVAAQSLLIRQGDPPDDLYFVESGRVTATLNLGDRRKIRLRTMGPGSVVGEIGFYLDVPRTASISAEEPVRGYRLTRDALRRMEREQPLLAAAFHEFMVRLLADRLAETNHTLRAVMD
jgi:SulP family sulfate permease